MRRVTPPGGDLPRPSFTHTHHPPFTHTHHPPPLHAHASPPRPPSRTRITPPPLSFMHTSPPTPPSCTHRPSDPSRVSSRMPQAAVLPRAGVLDSGQPDTPWIWGRPPRLGAQSFSRCQSLAPQSPITSGPPAANLRFLAHPQPGIYSFAPRAHRTQGSSHVHGPLPFTIKELLSR